MDTSAIVTSVASAVLVGGGGMGLRWIGKRLRGVEQILEDWHSEPPRPGFPARRGIPERVQVLETEQADTRVRVRALEDRAALWATPPGGQTHPGAGAPA